MIMRKKIAVAGAGIYGSTAAIRLAEQGHDVSLFDPLGIMGAASAINACRVHAGYHYPRSPETIAEIAEARAEFLAEFADAVVHSTRNFYAIPKNGSRTSPGEYEQRMQQYGLPLRTCRPEWIDFGFIQACYEVDEHLYDPDILRRIITERLRSLSIHLNQQKFTSGMRSSYDSVIWATYGLGASRRFFPSAKIQVAEKVLINLPNDLRSLAVVVIDGPFTAFDSYGHSGLSLFGSAKHTNHWSTTASDEPVPERYSSILNTPQFTPVAFTRFEAMRTDCAMAIPGAKDAEYLGSRFTLRVVENSPEQDRRTLYVVAGDPGEFHIFAGKVVSAVKAARLVCEAVTDVS
jgi:hypothetical protein